MVTGIWIGAGFSAATFRSAMNRSFTIDVRGFSEKAEGAVERLIADFAAALPSHVAMDSAALVTEKKPSPKRPRAAKSAQAPAPKGKAGGKARK